MNELRTWKFISEQLEKNQPLIFMCVLESSGSSPGRQGFKMAVAEDGICGSVGGGMMEYKFVELAKEKLRTDFPGGILKKQLHQKQAEKNRSGMICSGEQTIWMQSLTPNDLPVLARIISKLEENKNGTLQISPDGISFTDENLCGANFHMEMRSENDFLYVEKTGYKNLLFIIGGGHCSLALSKLMCQMDFYISVFDDRKNLNTIDENQFAHEIKIINNYDELSQIIPAGPDHFIVIMTFGYRTDDLALRAVIDKEFKYLGVLGSKSKMEQLFSDWKKDNLPEEKLNKIYSPIGISINSQTPEEIAVSIASEIIKVKNADYK